MNKDKNTTEYASPESVGIPSAAISDFIDALTERNLPIHGFILMRRGKIVEERYAFPFTSETRHRLYSASKSFTAIAVGMLVTEGKLCLDDRVADFFPEYLPASPSPYTLKATVRDLLVMATPNDRHSYWFTDKDFVRTFFDNNIKKHEPGAVFSYDTAGTVTLCAVVEKIAGKPILDYMRPIFDEIGVSRDIDCIKTPEGRSWTGSGILCRPIDLLKVGRLCMQYGNWNGRQLIDRRFMTEATTKQIDVTVTRSSFLREGYGYQIWVLKNGGFAFCGMGGQYVLASPEKETVAVITADTQEFVGVDDTVKIAFYHLLDAMESGEAKTDPNGVFRAEISARRLEKLPVPPGTDKSPFSDKISGKTYDLEENPSGFKTLRADIKKDGVTLTFEKRGNVITLPLGLCAWKSFVFPEAYAGMNAAVYDTHYKCIGYASWIADDSVLVKIFAVDDYLGSIRMQLTFKGDTVTVVMAKNAENFFNDYSGFLCGKARE